MKKLISRITYGFARITGWRRLALISGLAFLSACHTKSDQSGVSKDSIPDSVRVKCYEQMELNTASTQAGNDSVLKEEIPAVIDSSELKVPLHPCYVPVKPKE
ncbi:MAG: hypothetical protein RB294_08845 [Bacteroidales bacterium]|jgi:hypothetical protein|nr:hypothetical protein [Bacteroidales bacterium]HPB01331.1 hypothetical protein [Bacteroidales bacterium]